MPSQKNEMLEFKQYMKSNTVTYIIDTDLELLIRWMRK